MKPIKYSTWKKVRDLIRDGADIGGTYLESLNIEVPGLGIMLDIAAKTLGWSLVKLWDSLPHENEPRPSLTRAQTFSNIQATLQSHLASQGIYNKYSKFVPLPPVIPDAYHKLIAAVAETHPALAAQMAVPVLPANPLDTAILRFQPTTIRDVVIGKITYPKKDVAFAEEPREQIRYPRYGLNPTYGRAGF